MSYFDSTASARVHVSRRVFFSLLALFVLTEISNLESILCPRITGKQIPTHGMKK